MLEHTEKIEGQEAAESVSKKEIRFQAFLSYPEIKIERKNTRYGQAMLDNIGGSNSEMSAVSLYFYNSVLSKSYDDVAYTFHKISIVEMRHLHIFSNLAYELGIDPRLWTKSGNKMTYWSPGYSKYPTQLPRLLLNAIEGERRAIAKYQAQMRWIKDRCILENLNHIIEDEKLHVEILLEIYEKYS